MNNYQKKFSLKNKNIVIVGGTGLVGQEVCYALSNLGANISIFDIDKKKGKVLEKKITKSGYKAKFYFFDCTKKSNIKKIFQKIFKNKIFPDTLINCSYPRTKDWKNHNFKNISLNSYEKNISIHLNSYIWLSKIFAESLKQKNIKGNIIHFGSIYGVLGQDLSVYKNTEIKENLTYSVIKGAIVNYTRQMASYYGRHNIRVNAICPGGVYGPVQGVSSKQSKKFLTNYSKKVPLGRLANSSEIAAVVAFLASPASSYINGSILMVDGGWSAV